FMHHDLQNMAQQVGTRYGLISAELNVVDILGRFGGTSMGELARRTFISPANTTRTVKTLEQKKLVARTRNATSGRNVDVALTGKGQALFKKCYPAIFGAAVRYFGSSLSARERHDLRRLMEKLVPPMNF
ncbi:MAG: MarR family transcriptional regulator, partial [Rhodospirillaceae bacterium]|nr:MarR family transcriptional regulator [Rhodospirillaceae bacterium]